MKKLLPPLLVAGIAMWSVWPVAEKPARVANIGKDGELIIWIINQTVSKVIPQSYSGYLRQIVGTQRGVWDGNIYYPYRNVLAYSDMFILSGLFVWPMVAIAGNPAVAGGWVMVIGQVATMLVVYGWWKEITGKRWPAALGAIALGLAQFRWHYQVHLQMWSMQYWLLGTWLFWRWLRNGRDWQLWAAGALVGLQAWESVLPVYFAASVILIMILVLKPHPTLSLDQACRLTLREQERVNKLVLPAILAGIIALGPILAYTGVNREFGFERSIREAANNGLGPDYIWRWFGSPGVCVLLAAAIIQLLRTSPLLYPPPEAGGGKDETGNNIGWLAGVMILGVVMTLGPTLKWEGKTVKIAGKIPIPLPYAAAYYLVPGFEAFRTPSRWFWLTGWAASGLIAIGIRSKAKGLRRGVGMAGALAVAVLGGTHLTNFREIPAPDEYPAVYKWLQKQPGKTVLELPRGDENIETERMIYSLGHGKQLINGFSGFTPPEAGEVKPDYIVVDKSKQANYDLKSKKLWEDGRYLVLPGQ